MKKYMSFIFIFLLVFTLGSCNKKTDQEKVEKAKDNLKISFKESGNTLANVTDDLILVNEQDGVSVTWSSNNKSLVSDGGDVVLPSEDTVVELTATLTLNDAKTTKKFSLTIKSNVKPGESDKDIGDWFD